MSYRAVNARVVIVGAGIAGLAAARALHAAGATVEIVERAPSPATEGTGIFLPGNAVRALHQLGLGPQIDRRAIKIERQRFTDHRGRVLVDLDPARVWNQVGACLAVHRTALLDVLLAGVPEVPIRWGVVARTATTDHDGASLDLSDGTTVHCDIVIGADGVHSSLRRYVADEPAHAVGRCAQRFVVHRPGWPPIWSVHLGPASSFLTIPVGDDRVYCYCDGAAEPRTTMRELLARFAEPVPSMLDALDRAGTDTVHAGPIEEVVLSRWSRGRVLLIGDAAHATSPNMAQGAAMALEDALVLADSLATADAITDAFHTYERRRRPRTDWVLHQTHRRDRIRSLPAVARNLVLRRSGEKIYRANYEPLLAPA